VHDIDSLGARADTWNMAQPASRTDLHLLAHDLRSPLASIRANAEAALLDDTLDDATKVILEKIIEDVDSLARRTEMLYPEI